MATTYQGSMDELASRVELYKRNPTLIQRAILDYLSEVTNGDINIVDVTNPFVFLLEASSVNTVAAINQNNINLRAQYPALAQTDEDIFRHLSDTELMNRFSSPSSVEFIFMAPLSDLKKNMVRVEEERLSKIVIARDTEITVDTVTYTLSYPIVITLHDTGGLLVAYDTERMSPIENIKTNNITPIVQTAPDGSVLVYFKAKVKQLKLEKQEWVIEAKSIFKKNLAIKDKFFYARAYHKSNMTGSKWEEINTTHSDQVYDLKKPTVCFKVLDSVLQVYIPHVYITNGLIGSSVRVDIYTTKGDYSVNYQDQQLTSFSCTLRNLDSGDDSIFTTSMNNVALQVFSTDINSGGVNGIPFEELRERTIYHSNGEQDTPITHENVRTKAANYGFDVVQHVDVVTDRIFYATRNLPAPENKRLLTPVNISIGTTVLDTSTLEDSPAIARNVNRLTLKPGNLYQNKGGIIGLVPYSEVQDIKRKEGSELVQHVNSNAYLYTPFYYVLDFTKTEFDFRAYDLDMPSREEINFVSQNDSIQMPVNSSDIIWRKSVSGYELYIKTTSGNFYKAAANGDVGMQLGYIPDGESHMAYIQGELYSVNDEDRERVWLFKIETNHDLNDNDCLAVTNAKMFVDEPLTTWMPLNTTFYLMHYTSSITDIYRVDTADGYLGKFLAGYTSRVITMEKMDVKLGVALDNLWKRSRTIPTGQEYKKHQVDAPMFYDKDVYETDAFGKALTVVNGEVVMNKIHSAGDPVLDANGAPVYEFMAGDVMVDANGNPIVSGDTRYVRELDILFFDGSLFFVTDDSMASYRRNVVDIIVDWVIDDIALIEDDLLDKTNIYFYPKSTLGKVPVRLSSTADAVIDAQQNFTLDLLVTKAIYDSQDVRDLIKKTAITVINSFIGLEEVNMVEINSALLEAFDNGVISFNLSGLGGDKNYTLLKLKNLQHSLCIAKRLAVQADGTYIVEDAITVNFTPY